MKYLKNFYKKLKRWKGSLVKVESLKEQNAKEYLNRLAKADLVERISWGWYWIPKSSVRTGQVLGYGCYKLNKLTQKKLFPVRKTSLEDRFIQKEVDEAIEKVAAYG